MQQIEVRPGLKLLIRDFQPRENVALTFQVEFLPLVFSFLVSGTIRNCLRLGLWKKEFDFVAGQSSISSFSEMAGTAEHPAGQRMRMINIWISPLLLNSFLEGESGQKGSKTLMQYDNVDYNIGLSDALFEQSNLKR